MDDFFYSSEDEIPFTEYLKRKRYATFAFLCKAVGYENY